MKQRTENLPTATYKGGRWHLSEPYDLDNRVTCSVYGEMSDGAKVWTDEAGKQYTRQKIHGKYFFCEM